MNEVALRLAAKLFDRPLIQNQYRSAFIEAMLEPYLEPDGWRYAGGDWGGWDFERGEEKLEVKQSAAHQTWKSADQPPFRGTFDIAARSGYWEGGKKWVPRPGIRHAEIYIFAWNPFYGDATDHRDPRQWEFYVVAATALPAGQRTIGLSKIKRIVKAVKIDGVATQCHLARRA